MRCDFSNCGNCGGMFLQMSDINRLETMLQPIKQVVFRIKAAVYRAVITNQDAALRRAVRKAFFKTIHYNMLCYLNAPSSCQQCKPDFRDYQYGFL